jgi:predicted GH43/DUF377 family glycosyl hydrolase
MRMMITSDDGRLKVRKSPERLIGDPARVITRLFIPGGDGRIEKVLERVAKLPEDEVTRLLSEIRDQFGHRHRDIESVFAAHFRAVSHKLDEKQGMTEARRLLIGAYFTCEYSLESVALFNPCMVPHPDQSGMEDGSTRFLISLRACGEGHISSIEFRTGTVDAKGEVKLDPPGDFALTERPVADRLYAKHPFFLKLIEMGSYNEIAERILSNLDERFTFDQLERAVGTVGSTHWTHDSFKSTAESVLWLARSNYHLDFPDDSDIPERVIFPVAENESRGIEDARFVQFTHPDGQTVYYATYSAYNGFMALPMFIETLDFKHFRINTLNGKYARHKGLAVFPRKIGDEYLMIGRPDGETLHLLRSDNIHFWNEGEVLRVPMQPWELVQVGNCGSPLETEEGWLLLTHGVGPMRRYCIGALLLDLEDPRRVIGHMNDPILEPTPEERDGYVPNVVYSCGAMLHNGFLVMPYAMADTMSGIATVPLSHILSNMTRS